MALELVIGSMYSGKSTELMRRVKRVQSIGMRCLIINHANDTRVQGDFVQTHDGNTLAATKTDDLLLVSSLGNFSLFKLSALGTPLQVLHHEQLQNADKVSLRGNSGGITNHSNSNLFSVLSCFVVL